MGRGGGGGQMCNDSSMELYATTQVNSISGLHYVGAVCPEDEKPSAEIQKGYKHA